jgi:hypothetical protein
MLFALAALLGPTNELDAAEGKPHVAEPQRRAVCRDSVIDRIDGYVTRYDLEDELYVVEDAVGSRPEFGGIYLSDEKGEWSGLEIVLLTTSCEIQDHLPAIEHSDRIRIVLVEHTYAQLTDLYEAISDAWLARDPSTSGMSEVSLDVTGNIVEVRFLDDSPAGQIVAGGGIPIAFADAFGTEGIRFGLIRREDLPMLMPAPGLPSPNTEVQFP